jgi:hypothetical protein
MSLSLGFLRCLLSNIDRTATSFSHIHGAERNPNISGGMVATSEPVLLRLSLVLATASFVPTRQLVWKTRRDGTVDVYCNQQYSVFMPELLNKRPLLRRSPVRCQLGKSPKRELVERGTQLIRQCRV